MPNIHHTTEKEKQFLCSQTRHQTENSGILPTQDISPPAEIRLTELPDAHSRMEDHLNLPVQVDTVTEILQERILEMTNTIDRREQQVIAKLQMSEERLYKKERKNAPPKASRWINVDKTKIMANHSPPFEAQPEPPATQLPIPSDNTNDTPWHPTQYENTSIPTKYPAADYQQLARLRAATTPNQLRGRDRKSVCIFYNSFVDFNRIYRIPLKILDDIRLDRLDDEDENIYPTGLREQAITRWRVLHQHLFCTLSV